MTKKVAIFHRAAVKADRGAQMPNVGFDRQRRQADSRHTRRYAGAISWHAG